MVNRQIMVASVLLLFSAAAVAQSPNCPEEFINTHLPLYDRLNWGACDFPDNPNMVCEVDLCGYPAGDQGWAQYCVFSTWFGSYTTCYG